ncbi:MAG TPA: ribonuclease HI family protein [Candidatus Dependentiae bacterium]|nr:ribonuclease HI family protein [Candidatus Dependentiae bacterium]
MEQLYLFTNADQETKKKAAINQQHEWLLFVDGASRNNPGPAGAGIYLLKNKIPVYKEGFFLGIKTNNEAEYLAFLLGIFLLQKRLQMGDVVRVVSDSELLVKQINGLYKVRRPHLKPLYALAQQRVKAIGAKVMHVLRTENKQADKMANRGIDYKKSLPADFITFLQQHEIEL